MKTKITIKDVAREAGVSVATVSYVLNNKNSDRISPETRKRVLHIINLLNYIPNKSAQALATSKSSHIALRFSAADSPIKAAQNHFILTQTAEFFSKHGYNTVFVPESFSDRISGVDAIVCFGLGEKEFKRLGDANFVPLIAVDSRIDDPLFFQINTDFDKVKIAADKFFNNEKYTLALTEISDPKLVKIIKSKLENVVFIKSREDFSRLSGNVLFTEKGLEQLAPDGLNSCFISGFADEKAQKLFDCIRLAESREKIENHDIFV